MKILYCISSLSGGGAERQLSYIATALVSANVEVHVAFLTKGPNPPNLDLEGVIEHQINHKSNYDPSILLQLISLIKKIKPDLVQSWNIQMDILTGIVTRFTRTKWLLREANSELATQNRVKKEKIRRFVSGWLSHIVANSQGGIDYWIKNRPEIGYTLIRNGIPSNAFIPVEEDGYRFNIIFAGRLVPQKNVKTLLYAFKNINHGRVKHLIICGSGIMEKELIELSEQLGIADKVKFMGWVDKDKLIDIMQKSICLVNPAFYEGCPNVVIEAMACNCPVVISDIPSHREILNESETIFFNPDDVDSLVAAIKTISESPEIMRNKVSFAFKKSKLFSLPNVAGQYLKLYTRLISESKKPSDPVVG